MTYRAIVRDGPLLAELAARAAEYARLTREETP